MDCDRARLRGVCGMLLGWTRLGASVLRNGAATLVLVGAVPATARAQQAVAAAPSLVFDGVTVVDVEQGRLLPAQRVVIVDNRIQAVGSGRAVPVPTGARVVDARGKYLIPGLWDMHVHPDTLANVFYPLFVANGITGIRDAASTVPLDTLTRWRQEILAGTRVGPPRQLLVGQAFSPFGLGSAISIGSSDEYPDEPPDTGAHVDPSRLPKGGEADSARIAGFARQMEDLKAHGANAIKTTAFQFALAAAARHVGLPLGGHMPRRIPITASDSGVKIFDHWHSGNLDRHCAGPKAIVADCQLVAERFKQNGTWWVPTLSIVQIPSGAAGVHVLRIQTYLRQRSGDFWAGSSLPGNWLRPADSVAFSKAVVGAPSEQPGALHVAQRVGLPILAGTDAMVRQVRDMTPGFMLHAELAMYVAEGLSPLEALRTATLNPAKLLHGTDSLGTVARGKLADLVLLDADPLADITNTTTIRAVVANGRYFDRAALDSLLAKVQAKKP